MPPKGRRICFDDIECSHNDRAKHCKKCWDKYAKLVASEEGYLCLDCRHFTQRSGYKWPIKGSVIQTLKPAKEDSRLNCREHNYKFDFGKRCNSCVSDFEDRVGECGKCNSYDPDKMKIFCVKHKDWWEARRRSWGYDSKLLEKAVPYPVGQTEDFLKGMEICLDPRKK